MKANPEIDLIVYKEKEPIRVFMDMPNPSSATCMYWNRFAPGTAGGAWSSMGMLNDGNGCLTTHLSDMGLFLDGRLPTLLMLEGKDVGKQSTEIKPTNIV